MNSLSLFWADSLQAPVRGLLLDPLVAFTSTTVYVPEQIYFDFFPGIVPILANWSALRSFTPMETILKTSSEWPDWLWNIAKSLGKMSLSRCTATDVGATTSWMTQPLPILNSTLKFKRRSKKFYKNDSHAGCPKSGKFLYSIKLKICPNWIELKIFI